jgi:hypothetical protein
MFLHFHFSFFHRELLEGGAGREVTADPSECVHHLGEIRKFRNILPEGERGRGPPFMNRKKNWSSSVTEKTKPENIENKKKVERKIKIQEEIMEAKLEVEEEQDKESGSKKKDRSSHFSFFIVNFRREEQAMKSLQIRQNVSTT